MVCNYKKFLPEHQERLACQPVRPKIGRPSLKLPRRKNANRDRPYAGV